MHHNPNILQLAALVPMIALTPNSVAYGARPHVPAGRLGAVDCSPFSHLDLVSRTPADQLKQRVRARFARLRKLTPGWDGMNSVGIDEALITVAAFNLDSALTGIGSIAEPAIVPCGDGGLQVEWHVPTGKFEMYFDTDGAITAWMQGSDGREIEGEGEEAQRLLKVWIARIATRPRILAAA